MIRCVYIYVHRNIYIHDISILHFIRIYLSYFFKYIHTPWDESYVIFFHITIHISCYMCLHHSVYIYIYTHIFHIFICIYIYIYILYIYIRMWQGPFGIMRTIACFKHPTPASVLVPFLSPCLPPCSLQLVPLLLFLPLSCCPSLCMYILDAQVSLFSICLRACLPLFSSGSVLSFLPNHWHSSPRLLVHLNCCARH